MRATWIGVQGAERDKVLAALRLEVLPDALAGDWHEGDYSCRTFPGGWFVVASQEGLDLATDLVSASATTEQLAMGCEMSTIVMYSEACGYQDGQLQWSVIHDPDDSACPLAVEGEPPAILAELDAKAVEDQAAEAGVDFVFDVPMQLVAHYTGFVYDEDEATDWVRLRATATRPVGRDRRKPRRRPRPQEQIDWSKLTLWNYLGLGVILIILFGWLMEQVF